MRIGAQPTKPTGLRRFIVLSDRRAALGGIAPFLYGTGWRVTLGGLVFDRPRLGFSQARSGSSSRTERDGIIGNALLEDFVVTVDYRRRTLVLRRPRPYADGWLPPSGGRMWLPFSLHRIRAPHPSFRLKPEATHEIYSQAVKPQTIHRISFARSP